MGRHALAGDARIREWNTSASCRSNGPLTQLDFLSYPYSHSLVALIGWGLLLGVAYRSVFGGRRTVWVISGLVVSHWVLDYITHLPDMPIYPGGPKIGLGLWRSTLWTVVIETAMYAAGVWIYMTTTRARDRIGRWGFVSLAAFMMLIYVASLTSGPPPSVQAIAIAGILGAALIDRLGVVGRSPPYAGVAAAVLHHDG